MRNEIRITITSLPFNTALEHLAIAIRQEKKKRKKEEKEKKGKEKKEKKTCN